MFTEMYNLSSEYSTDFPPLAWKKSVLLLNQFFTLANELIFCIDFEFSLELILTPFRLPY